MQNLHVRAENIDVRPKLKRTMPQQEQNEVQKYNIASSPVGENAKTQRLSGEELFVEQMHQLLSEREIFITEEDFSKSLEQKKKTPPVRPQTDKKHETQTQTRQERPRRLSRMQKILALGIVAIAAVLLYTLFQKGGYLHNIIAPPANHIETALQTPPPLPPEVNAPATGERQNQTKIAVAAPPDQLTAISAPLSLKVAQDFYRQKEYDKAIVVYYRLNQSLPEKDQLKKDFLKLKMALCTMKAGRLEDADRMLNQTAKSDSHIVQLMTNYHRISLEMQRKQYLIARKRAYRVIALLAAVDIETSLASELRSNCYFLIAEAMTRYVLSLSDEDSDLPGKLWSTSAEIDPFAGLDNDELQALLKSGDDYLTDALLTPQIRKITTEDGTIRWSALCNGAPIEELLARFASNADLDVSWIFSNTKSTANTRDIAHTRPVVLYLPVANSQQLIAAAAGQVGLLAQISDEKSIAVYQPDKFSSLTRHISLLCDETISLWQRFLLTFQSDKRIANAHFALGLLYARRGDIPEAIAEHKLVANKFSFSSLAPYALLHSSRFKSAPNVKDFVGAKQDLEQLVSQYPDSEVTTRAYVHLADYTAKAGLIEEAAKIYRKVYNLALSAKSQAVAALGAGKCFHQTGDYNAAAKWLALHIDLAESQKNQDVCTAYALLGKTYLALNDPRQASLALHRAIEGQLPREQYVQTVSDLINGYVRQGKFIQALDTLENVDFWQFSQAESVRVLLLKSRILRDMGLTDKAITVLGDQAEYISDKQLKAELIFEIANCYVTRGQLQAAHEELTQLLIVVRPGPLAYKIAIRLAEICSLLGLDEQVISVCTQLKEADVPEETRQKAAVILARAHKDRQDYDNAALALLK
ncbi:MAG: tetratricopeptide repeat protein [Planctomycetota bacterium]|jgi:tetratricopeptide (TPR) repeat protein